MSFQYFFSFDALNDKVANRLNTYRKKMIMAASLLGVYCMYLLFFQGFLINPFNETTKKFKKGFSHKVTLPKRNSGEVADYTQVNKKNTASNRACDFISGLLQTTVSPLATADLQQASLQSKSQKHRPDDSYRLYLLWQAILV